MIIRVNLPNYSSLGYRDALVDIAQTAEALGYASLWTSDHVLLPTKVLITESPEGGWGLQGHANTNANMTALALAALSAT